MSGSACFQKTTSQKTGSMIPSFKEFNNVKSNLDWNWGNSQRFFNSLNNFEPFSLLARLSFKLNPTEESPGGSGGEIKLGRSINMSILSLPLKAPGEVALQSFNIQGDTLPRSRFSNLLLILKTL